MSAHEISLAALHSVYSTSTVVAGSVCGPAVKCAVKSHDSGWWGFKSLLRQGGRFFQFVPGQCGFINIILLTLYLTCLHVQLS